MTYVIKVPGYLVQLDAGHCMLTAGAGSIYPLGTQLRAGETETALARRVMELEIALLTVKDRINGVWDSPRLKAYGPLAIDPDVDVLRMITKALEQK